MRIAILGGSESAVRTTELLLKQDHEVVMVEVEKSRIDELSEELDCSFLHGDGAKPAVLQEVGPEQTDVLCCLTDNDQANILASLVGRSLGFSLVITSLQDPELEGICKELGLEGIIIPSRITSRYLADMIRGVNTLELSNILKDEARFFHFVVESHHNLSIINDLKLPDEARVICIYRKGKLTFVDQDSSVKSKDEIVILTHSQHLEDFQERWVPKSAKPKN